MGCTARLPSKPAPCVSSGSTLSRSIFRAHRVPKRLGATGAYTEALITCEAESDWPRTLEIVAEVKALKLDLPEGSWEVAVRTLATGGRWERCTDIFEKLRARGHVPQPDTFLLLVSALARANQTSRCHSLLKEMSTVTDFDLTPSYNVLTRGLAKAGDLDAALEQVEWLQKALVRVEYETYNALVNACIKADRQELVEELLEQRDYL